MWLKWKNRKQIGAAHSTLVASRALLKDYRKKRRKGSSKRTPSALLSRWERPEPGDLTKQNRWEWRKIKNGVVVTFQDLVVHKKCPSLSGRFKRDFCDEPGSVSSSNTGSLFFLMTWTRKDFNRTC